MASKVEVLCPNGHRVYVRITPNTKLVSILEEACVKQGFLPSADYNLVHVQTRKVVDITLTIRFAGLPNNAKFELVKAEKSRVDNKVTVALQLPTGERMKAEFNSQDTIWSVMEYFEKENSPSFMKYEATLEGRANLQPVCVYLREEVIGEFAMRETTLKDLGLMGGSGIIRLLHKPVEPSLLKDIEERITKAKVKRAALLARIDTSENTSIQLSEASVDDVEMEVNVLEPETQDLADQDKDVMVTEDSNQANVVSNAVIDDVKELHSETQICGARPKRPLQDKPITQTSSQQLFANFKFPEETKGQELYCNEMADEKEIIKCKPCERNSICYSAEESSMPQVESVEPDDEFFELTEADVRKIYMDLQQRLKEEDETQLLTQAMRKAKAEERLARYDYVFIRFTFPDKLVLQATFRPREPVYNLYKFITEQLKERDACFYLFTSPPKHILEDKTMTLIEAQLVPMTVVYVGFDKMMDKYLQDTVLNNISSQIEANRKIVEMMHHSDLAEPSAETSKVPTKRQGNETAAPKLPKWFKTGKK